MKVVDEVEFVAAMQEQRNLGLKVLVSITRSQPIPHSSKLNLLKPSRLYHQWVLSFLNVDKRKRLIARSLMVSSASTWSEAGFSCNPDRGGHVSATGNRG